MSHNMMFGGELTVWIKTLEYIVVICDQLLLKNSKSFADNWGNTILHISLRRRNNFQC